MLSIDLQAQSTWFVRQSTSLARASLSRLEWLARESLGSTSLCLPTAEITSGHCHVHLLDIGTGD